MEPNDLTNTLLVHYKIHQRIIALQERLITILKQSPNETQIIESLETLIDELKAVLK
jgi:hypothetical protein